MVFDRFAVAYGIMNFVLFLTKFLYCLCEASGYGFGLISGTFAIINVLSDMVGPGTIGIFGHSHDFFIATGKRIRSMQV